MKIGEMLMLALGLSLVAQAGCDTEEAVSYGAGATTSLPTISGGSGGTSSSGTGGTGGAGGSPAGGSSAGGAGGAGGQGGGDLCELEPLGECTIVDPNDPCQCCLDLLCQPHADNCCTTAGCTAVALCIVSTGCDPNYGGCYWPSTCKSVIDQHGTTAWGAAKPLAECLSGLCYNDC